MFNFSRRRKTTTTVTFNDQIESKENIFFSSDHMNKKKTKNDFVLPENLNPNIVPEEKEVKTPSLLDILSFSSMPGNMTDLDIDSQYTRLIASFSSSISQKDSISSLVSSSTVVVVSNDAPTATTRACTTSHDLESEVAVDCVMDKATTPIDSEISSTSLEENRTNIVDLSKAFQQEKIEMLEKHARIENKLQLEIDELRREMKESEKETTYKEFGVQVSLFENIDACVQTDLLKIESTNECGIQVDLNDAQLAAINGTLSNENNKESRVDQLVRKNAELEEIVFELKSTIAKIYENNFNKKSSVVTLI